MKISPLKEFDKTIIIPGDKSITQRAILFGAFSKNQIKITNPLLGEDCLSCIECVKKLGASVEIEKNTIIVKGADKIKSANLFVGNSGTTLRLISGLLAGQKGERFLLDGDSSIKKRPMARVIEPLRKMGASLSAVDNKAPLAIEGASLQGIGYTSPIASAQVKSAVLLAGLFANKKTTITEPYKSRDHTERMLRYFGVEVVENGTSVTISPSTINAKDIEVVGDISSAAFFLVLAASLKGARLTAKNAGVNKTRDGILRVLKSCGANYRLENKKQISGEPSADIVLEYAKLKPFNITKELVPLLVDEIPILAVLACFIEGKSVISGAEELKFKESNRIDTTVNFLKKMGADINATDDGMVINGTGFLNGGAVIDSHLDHRIAMSSAIAGALSKEGVEIKNAECAAVSYPNFYEVLV